MGCQHDYEQVFSIGLRLLKCPLVNCRSVRLHLSIKLIHVGFGLLFHVVPSRHVTSYGPALNIRNKPLEALRNFVAAHYDNRTVLCNRPQTTPFGIRPNISRSYLAVIH